MPVTVQVSCSHYVCGADAVLVCSPQGACNQRRSSQLPGLCNILESEFGTATTMMLPPQHLLVPACGVPFLGVMFALGDTDTTAAKA